ncbi:TadE/TadG family type IV pilus assembly protein [Vibrio hippocampi]|uniref:TadE-like domain-containing protein n=1 Tax=Vibrio hippocampi TaxID=654686 RepID=A0ABN8DM48_9VIBR|nr:pilus assembly protein [Vibrio hippocampi]CAH0529501.1 hypothetical protein VHP8226_03255 [Vibrio hippocampi]
MSVCRVKQRGITTIELAVGAIALIITTLMLFEAGHKIYVSNLVEFALRETIRDTQIHQGSGVHQSYQDKLDGVLQHEGRLWSYLVDEHNFELTGEYFNSYADFVANNGSSIDGEMFFNGYPLAEFTLSYQYQPIFNLFGDDGGMISRSTVINLEHEGWE